METTLYDGKGRPKAYIADDGEQSIYLWSGHAVAYIVNEVVHGWNGKHLGWYVNGVLYDLKGRRVGSIQDQCPYACYAEPAKYAKYAQYAKYAPYTPYAQSSLYTSYSDQALEDFLKSGAVGRV